MFDNEPTPNKLIKVYGQTMTYPQAADISIENLERFLKDEILGTKVCACPDCNYRRKLLRGLQYVLADYKKIIKEK